MKRSHPITRREVCAACGLLRKMVRDQQCGACYRTPPAEVRAIIKSLTAPRGVE